MTFDCYGRRLKKHRVSLMAVPAMWLLVTCMGCQQKESINPSLPAPGKPITSPSLGPTDAQILAGLRFEAGKRGLRWKVFCMPDYHNGTARHYQADTSRNSEPEGAIYIEEGRQDWWSETGDTAIAAAYRLYLDLSSGQPPNMHPDHDPTTFKENADCNYNHVYDSEHAGKIPCTKEKRRD